MALPFFPMLPWGQLPTSTGPSGEAQLPPPPPPGPPLRRTKTYFVFSPLAFQEKAL